MKAIFALFGAGIGALIVNSYMLDTVDQNIWLSFWDAMRNGGLSKYGIEQVLHSAIFAKSIVGMIVGAMIGISFEITLDLLYTTKKSVSANPTKKLLGKVFCTKCGKENKSDAKFCTSCGSGIEVSE
jgi:hypothetical protein